MQPAQCIGCAHYRIDYECNAFPHGIPDEIILGRIDHTRPYPGDNGIRFEPRRMDGESPAPP
jgi:hypothetical protein